MWKHPNIFCYLIPFSVTTMKPLVLREDLYPKQVNEENYTYDVSNMNYKTEIIAGINKKKLKYDIKVIEMVITSNQNPENKKDRKPYKLKDLRINYYCRQWDLNPHGRKPNRF